MILWDWRPHTLCVQMDFTRTFQTNTKCNNINHVCSHFYNFFVILKYHRCLWANIFDTDIYRCINTYIKVYLWSYKCLCKRYWLIGVSYQYLTEMTSNMIYIVALGVGLKCPRKIHLNTQCSAGVRRPCPQATQNILHMKTAYAFMNTCLRAHARRRFCHTSTVKFILYLWACPS